MSVNGQIVGTQRVDRDLGVEWTVPYVPGRVEAVARRGGRIVATVAAETTGLPVALRLTPARKVMTGSGEDVQPITVDAIDARGRHVPVANDAVRFEVEGGTIIGLGNGDPNSHEPEQGHARALFNGLAQVILRAEEGEGRVVLTATAPGMRKGRLVMPRTAVPTLAQVPATVRVQRLAAWRRSPGLPARPSADLTPSDGDNNSWAFVQAGVPTRPDAGGRWRVYRTALRPWRRIAADGGFLRFDAVQGRAELWVDGHRIADKPDAAVGRLTGALVPGNGRREVVLLVEAAAGASSGIVGPVSVSPR